MNKAKTTLTLDADVATGEPCVVHIAWQNIIWFACISDSRIDLGTTGGVIHLLWDENTEGPPRNPKSHSQNFVGFGPAYWPEEDFESVSEQLSADFNS